MKPREYAVRVFFFFFQWPDVHDCIYFTSATTWNIRFSGGSTAGATWPCIACPRSPCPYISFFQTLRMNYTYHKNSRGSTLCGTYFPWLGTPRPPRPNQPLRSTNEFHLPQEQQRKHFVWYRLPMAWHASLAPPQSASQIHQWISLTTRTAEKALCVIQISHGLARLARPGHPLATSKALTCKEYE